METKQIASGSFGTAALYGAGDSKHTPVEWKLFVRSDMEVQGPHVLDGIMYVIEVSDAHGKTLCKYDSVFQDGHGSVFYFGTDGRSYYLSEGSIDVRDAAHRVASGAYWRRKNG